MGTANGDCILLFGVSTDDDDCISADAAASVDVNKKDIEVVVVEANDVVDIFSVVVVVVSVGA